MKKESFILFTEYAEEIELLSDEEAGIFIKAIFAYECGRQLPELTGGAKLLFSIVRRRLDENWEKYQEKCKSRSLAGQKGGKASAEKRKDEQTQAEESKSQAKGNKAKQNQANVDFACGQASKSKQIQHDLELDLELDLDTDLEGQGIKGKSDVAGASAGRAQGFAPDSHPYQAAVYLDEQIRARLPSQRPAGEHRLQLWADAFDKCQRIDGHSWEEIGQVLRFSQKDPFWSVNILSGGKFREKYVQLLAKMQAPPRASPNDVKISTSSYDIDQMEEMSGFLLPKDL